MLQFLSLTWCEIVSCCEAEDEDSSWCRDEQRRLWAVRIRCHHKKKDCRPEETHNSFHADRVWFVLCFRLIWEEARAATQTSASSSLTLPSDVYKSTNSQVTIDALTSCTSGYVCCLQMFQPFLPTRLCGILLSWHPVNNMIDAGVDVRSSALQGCSMNQAHILHSATLTTRWFPVDRYKRQNSDMQYPGLVPAPWLKVSR